MAASMAAEYVIRNGTAEQVVDVCRQAAEEMGLQVIEKSQPTMGRFPFLRVKGR